MELSDEAIIKALTRAGVPKRYRRKDIKLQDAVPYGEPLLELINRRPTSMEKPLGTNLAKGSVLEIMGTEAEATDSFYLGVRSLVLKRTPITIVNALHFIDADDEWLKALMDHRVLAIEGMTPHGADPFGSHRSFIEWQLIHWLNSERGLLILSDGEIGSDDRWSERFRRILQTRKVEFHVSR
jgi:hypothetical protein